MNAYIQKGLSLFRLADKASDRPAAYSAAQRAFVALNRRESDHPLPLIFYYRSFVAQGKEPSQLAIDGLSRAADIAPFDTDLLLTLAIAQIRRSRASAA